MVFIYKLILYLLFAKVTTFSVFWLVFNGTLSLYDKYYVHFQFCGKIDFPLYG